MSTVFHDLSQESRNIVVGGLKSCSSRNGVDELFNKYDIHESEVRIALLREAMGNPETFYSHKLPQDKMYEQGAFSAPPRSPGKIQRTAAPKDCTPSEKTWVHQEFRR